MISDRGAMSTYVTIGQSERNILRRHKVISGSMKGMSLEKGYGKVKDQSIGMLEEGDMSE